jgi:hypothetical protein
VLDLRHAREDGVSDFMAALSTPPSIGPEVQGADEPGRAARRVAPWILAAFAFLVVAAFVLFVLGFEPSADAAGTCGGG